MSVKARREDSAHAGMMTNPPDADATIPERSVSRWRDVVWPREHGSWSLALEPLAFGLIVAPSPASALLALAVAAAFFARRPLRIALLEAEPARRTAARRALAVLTVVAMIAMAGALWLRGGAWIIWLAPAAVMGAVFLSYDLRSASREAVAELAGTGAFAFVPAAMGAMAGLSAANAGALAFVLAGRSAPTVLCIRACLREQKYGAGGAGPAIASAIGAVVIAALAAYHGVAPWAAVWLLGGLAIRAGWLLVFPRPTLRARTLGMFEAVYGLVFVVVAGWAWRG